MLGVHPETTEIAEPTTQRRVIRWAVRIAYLAALAAALATGLLPGGRIQEAGWMIGGVLAFTIDRPLRQHIRVLVDWLPLVAALMVYDYTRDLADKLGMPLRMHELVTADRWMFGGTLPTVWLQSHLAADGSQPWWTPIIGVVYTTHFILPWATAAIFYVYSRPLWARYMRRILLLSYLALVTYVLVPAAPPWYASHEGAIGEQVRRISGFGLGLVSPDISAQWLTEHGNFVAALPSLHTAFSVLVAATLWPLTKRWWLRAVLIAYPCAMGFTLVYGGEHYVLDVLLGCVYAGGTILLTRLWENWRAGRALLGPLPSAMPNRGGAEESEESEVDRETAGQRS
ncbi:PAP2 superfamily protein [Nocardia nova SH22a]|uniref:PAP2 superfamily protein n=1 Tax=Nocardia nova SH22a TaxID=1415166 RepID=W5TQ52_9NOCA|nr:phosphatase PAP2 family protein [Nocardia nova]AHH21367.1 PAP2 superfamily protein [Nocardia nova SH22a]